MSVRQTAEYWIQKLKLQTHLEGGYFRETHRCGLILKKDQLPSQFKGPRSASTTIYFLLEQGNFSAFHRIASDEQWHFYYGDPLFIYEINNDGQLIVHALGNNAENGESFQCVVRAGNWFAAKPADGSEYCLAGCTVAPGFDFEEFEMAGRDALAQQFPEHQSLIESLTEKS